MRIWLTAHFVALTLASTPAQQVAVCHSKPANIAALIAQAQSGDPKAQLELGKAYHETKDPEKLSLSAYWFEEAAERGNAEAEWRLSLAYAVGEGVPRDDRSALRWFKKAADDGQVQAQWALGMCYRDGRSVERDEKKAFDLFLRAAKQGDVDSQFSVAQMYEEGDVVPQDYGQALIWYQKAAEHVPDHGSAAQARNSLGFLHAEGVGIQQDYVTAYMYFAIAANKRNLDWVADRMTGSQIVEAQRRARQWVQLRPEPRACTVSKESERRETN